MIEPVACPFCGNKPLEDRIEPHTHILSTIGISDYPESFSVECVHCEFQIFSHNSREDAVARWNKRIIPPGFAIVPVEQVKDAREIIARLYAKMGYTNENLYEAMNLLDMALTAAKGE